MEIEKIAEGTEKDFSKKDIGKPVKDDYSLQGSYHEESQWDRDFRHYDPLGIG